MAKKEERICITKLGPNPSDCFLIDNTCDGMCVRCTQGMTRKEAIKKISSHLLMCDISTMDTDELAEAALNALLEGR